MIQVDGFPVVSVLMPVRNEEQHIVGAITSVLQQEVPLELLVIDGASTDRTVELIAGIADPRLRLLSNPAGTIPSALNIGLARSRGEFVARVDAHARISADYLQVGLRQLKDPEVTAVGGIRVAVAGTAAGRAIAAALSSPFGVGNSINHYADTPQDTDHASFGVYRAAVAKALSGWDEQLLANEDVDFDHRIRLAGNRIRFDPAMKIFWQVREDLPAFAHQYRRYGRGKAGMVRKNGLSAIRMRHLAAPGLVGVLAVACIAALTGRHRAAVGLAAPYLMVVSAATARIRRGDRSENRVKFVILASAFVTMHVSWGIGLLEGLLLDRSPAQGSATAPRPAGAPIRQRVHPTVQDEQEGNRARTSVSPTAGAGTLPLPNRPGRIRSAAQ